MPGGCRFCNTRLQHTFVDLGMSPPSNAYLDAARLNGMEPFFPLHAWVCDQCKLVQLEEFETPENIFRDYAYFSSYSQSWLDHARQYTDMMIDRFDVGKSSQVIEIASNDGYLLQYFRQKDIPVLGIEPAENVARVAAARGIDTRVAFFGMQTAEELRAEGRRGDLIIGNNVLAHVPDLNGFVAGLPIALADGGIITMEFPHLLCLMKEHQFDTIYHEHFSYFSLLTVERVFRQHGLKLFDVEELTTHGGSLRIFACHAGDNDKPGSSRLVELRDRELQAGMDRLDTYLEFSGKVHETKRNLLELLIRLKRSGRSIVGYGAPAKGNTLLNYCGIRTDFVDYTVDLSPHKQGKFLPGTHIPVMAPEKIAETRPDYILILPWNLCEEILEQLEYTRQWGCKFIVTTPVVRVIE